MPRMNCKVVWKICVHYFPSALPCCCTYRSLTFETSSQFYNKKRQLLPHFRSYLNFSYKVERRGRMSEVGSLREETGRDV